jgi:hypothetical protein
MKKPRYLKARNIMDKRALSPIFATMILALIVITLGSVAYAYVNNVTTTTTNQLKDNIADNQQTISERLSIENVKYIQKSLPSQPNYQLGVYIINNGLANAIIPRYFYIYSPTNVLIDNFEVSPLTMTTIDLPITTYPEGLNVGKEAYFTIDLDDPGLLPGTYNLRIVTENGSGFDYEFTIQ